MRKWLRNVFSVLERLFQTESEMSAQSRRRGWRTAHLFSNQTERTNDALCVCHT